MRARPRSKKLKNKKRSPRTSPTSKTGKLTQGNERNVKLCKFLALRLKGLGLVQWSDGKLHSCSKYTSRAKRMPVRLTRNSVTHKCERPQAKYTKTAKTSSLLTNLAEIINDTTLYSDCKEKTSMCLILATPQKQSENQTWRNLSILQGHHHVFTAQYNLLITQTTIPLKKSKPNHIKTNEKAKVTPDSTKQKFSTPLQYAHPWPAAPLRMSRNQTPHQAPKRSKNSDQGSNRTPAKKARSENTTNFDYDQQTQPQTDNIYDVIKKKPNNTSQEPNGKDQLIISVKNQKKIQEICTLLEENDISDYTLIPATYLNKKYIQIDFIQAANQIDAKRILGNLIKCQTLQEFIKKMRSKSFLLHGIPKIYTIPKVHEILNNYGIISHTIPTSQPIGKNQTLRKERYSALVICQDQKTAELITKKVAITFPNLQIGFCKPIDIEPPIKQITITGLNSKSTEHDLLRQFKINNLISHIHSFQLNQEHLKTKWAYVNLCSLPRRGNTYWESLTKIEKDSNFCRSCGNELPNHKNDCNKA